jgi:hypothetical protein
MIPIQRNEDRYKVESKTVIVKGDMLDIWAVPLPPLFVPSLDVVEPQHGDDPTETSSALEVWKL